MDIKNQFSYRAGTTPLQKELVRDISWFIILRWHAALGIMIIPWLANSILGLHIQLNIFIFLGIIVLIINTCYLYYVRLLKNRHLTDMVYFYRIADLQSNLDIIILTILIHYSGGIESPLAFYYVFHVIISAIITPKRLCYIHATFASLLFSSLVLLEYLGIIPHVSISGLLPFKLHDKGAYIFGGLFFFVSTLYITSYLATTISSRLKASYIELQNADREKTQFTLKITHELRSPLGAVHSLVRVIIDGYTGELPQKVRELLERVEKRISFLLNMVNKLLYLFAAGKIKLEEATDIDINLFLDRIIKSYESRIKEAQIKLTLEKGKRLPLLRAREEDMELIFSNLIDNAVKYTPEKGEIFIKTMNLPDNNKRLKVLVRDSGVGIKKEDMENIFKEFFRTGDAKEIAKEGTGLGLSIVKKIVEQYGGNIYVESEYGKGTTFNLELR